MSARGLRTQAAGEGFAAGGRCRGCCGRCMEIGMSALSEIRYERPAKRRCCCSGKERRSACEGVYSRALSPPVYVASEIVNAPLLPPACEFWAVGEVVAVAPGGLELSVLDSDLGDGFKVLVVDASIVVEAIETDPGSG